MLILGPTKWATDGGFPIEFARYQSNDQTAIVAVYPGSNAPALKLSVNLEAMGAEPPGPDQVWLKLWAENEGVLEAAIAAGLIEPIDLRTAEGRRFHCGHDAWAVLADLTSAAIAERDAQFKVAGI